MFKPVGKCFDFSMFKMHALFVSTFSAFRSELSWTLITGFDSLTTHYCPPLVECFIMVKMTSHCALLHEKQISKKLKRNNHLLTQICTPTLYHLLNIELFTKATSHQSYRAPTTSLYDCSSPSNASSVHNSCWGVCLAPLTLINNSRGSTVTFKRLPFHQYESTIKY